MVEMENVSAGYGKYKVLHNINLKLLKGQVTTLVGVYYEALIRRSLHTPVSGINAARPHRPVLKSMSSYNLHCPMARFELTEFRWKIFHGKNLQEKSLIFRREIPCRLASSSREKFSIGIPSIRILPSDNGRKPSSVFNNVLLRMPQERICNAGNDLLGK